jgi:hypothetical protein
MFGAGPGFQSFGGCFICLEFGYRVLIFYIFLTLFTGAPGDHRFSGRTGLGFYRLLYSKLLDCLKGKSRGF